MRKADIQKLTEAYDGIEKDYLDHDPFEDMDEIPEDPKVDEQTDTERLDWLLRRLDDEELMSSLDLTMDLAEAREFIDQEMQKDLAPPRIARPGGEWDEGLDFPDDYEL